VDLDLVLAEPSPTQAQLADLARAVAVSASVDRDALFRGYAVAASAASQARAILEGASAYASQSSQATAYEPGPWGLLSRLLPWTGASAQTTGVPCTDIDPVDDPTWFLYQQDQSSFWRKPTPLLSSDCANDVLLRVRLAALQRDGQRASEDREEAMADYCVFLEGYNDELLVVTGERGTAHAPPTGERLVFRPMPISFGDATFVDCIDWPETSVRPRVGAPVVSLDLGGSDTYAGAVATTLPGVALPVSLHVDAGGNDYYADPTGLYDGKALVYKKLGSRVFGHPTQAAAVTTGAAVLLDAGGADRYEAPARSQGYGRFGMGLLVDAAGSDGYSARNWTQGAASESMSLGLGILADAQEGDSYAARGGQGYGLGGLLLDAGGRDVYLQPSQPRGAPAANLSALPGASALALSKRGDGQVWTDGPASLAPGLGVDFEAGANGRDADADGDSDLVEFLAGSDPNDPVERAEDGPARRGETLAGDCDKDLFPDFLESALTTGRCDPASYPAGVPQGYDVCAAVLGCTGLGSLPRGGLPTRSDMILDLRLPLRDAGGVDRTCTERLDPRLGVSLPFPFAFQDEDGRSFPPEEIEPVSGEGSTACAYAQAGGQGQDAFTVGVQTSADSARRFAFPRGILAVGDVVGTTFREDYFVAIDLGGPDRFLDRAGGALLVGVDRGSTDARYFLAPSLAVSVDLPDETAAALRAQGFGRDVYDLPTNQSGDYAQGSMLGVLVDTRGDDQYSAGSGAQGALGGVLLDLAGSDRYVAANLSQGATVAGRARNTPAAYPDGLSDRPNAAAGGSRLVLDAPGLLLDLGDGRDSYEAAAHAQGFATGATNPFSPCSGCTRPTAGLGLLLDQGGADRYLARAESQGVGGFGATGVLLDAAGSDAYLALGQVSQGSTLSQTRGSAAPPSTPAPGAGVLADLGGRDAYAYSDLHGTRDRAAERQDRFTIERQRSPYASSGTTGSVWLDVGAHLDAEGSDPMRALGALGSSEGAPVADAARGFLVDLPTARLAIGDETDTAFRREYALAIDLGGANNYTFNAGGFVPDVLARQEAQGPDPASPQTNDLRSGDRFLATYPVSLLFDAGAGASNYTASSPLSQGAGFFSVGVLVDAGGHDRFTALPQPLWSGVSAWPQRAISVDGLVRESEWANVTAREIQLVATRDPRFAANFTLRVANDADRLYLAIQGKSGTPAADAYHDKFAIDLNPTRSPRPWLSDRGATGVDQLVVSKPSDSARCGFEDRGMTAAGAFVPDAAQLGGEAQVACTLSDGLWTIEVSKPLRVADRFDPHDMAYNYEPNVGFIERELGLRIEFREKGSLDTFVFPAGTANADGEAGYRRDGDLREEISDWAAVALANLGRAPAAAPLHTRPAALAQGAAVSGVGILAALGAEGSNGLYRSSEASQAYGAYGGFGLLLDAGGSDAYEGSRAVQAAAERGGAALLVDADGSDTYVSDVESNGWTPSESGKGVATFLDLHGFDRYDVHAFTPDGELSDAEIGDAVGEDGTNDFNVNLQRDGLRFAAGNQRAWHQGSGGFAVDHLSDDALRGVAGGFATGLLHGATNVRTWLRAYDPATRSCTSESLKPYLGKPVVTGRACLFAEVLLDQGLGASLPAGTTVGVDAVDFLLDGAVVESAANPHAGSGASTTWLLVLDGSRVDDGVHEVAALPRYRVEAQGRGASFHSGSPQAACDDDACATRRVVFDSLPEVDLALGPVPPGLDAPAFSPGAATAARNLYVNFTVSHDSGEDGLEVTDGFAAPRETRNAPCSADATRLCNVLPLYVYGGGSYEMRTTPDRQPRPQVVLEHSEDVETLIEPYIGPLAGDLNVSLEDGLVFHIPGRQAILSGNFTTRLQVLLTQGGRDSVVKGPDGKDIVLADQTFASYQNPSQGNVLSGILGGSPVYGVVEENLAIVQGLVAGASISGAAQRVADLCMSNDIALLSVARDQCNGDYGYTNSHRVCRSASGFRETFNREPLALCTRNTPRNLTVALARQADGELGGTVGTVTGEIGEQLAALGTPEVDPVDWREFHLDITSTGPLEVRDGAVRIPAGYGLTLKMWTTHDAIGQTGAKQTILETMLAAADLASSALDALPEQVDALPTPPRSELERNIRTAAYESGRLGEVLDRNVPASLFRYGSGEPDALTRLEVRTPTTPSTLVNVTIERPTENGTVRVLGERLEGDVAGSPTMDATGPDARGFWRLGAGDGRRFTERVLAFTGRDADGAPLVDSLGRPLLDGLYIVNVTATDPYTAKPVTRTAQFLLDATPPETSVATPDFAGAHVLENGLIPITWRATETGSGVSRVHVWSMDPAKPDPADPAAWTKVPGSPFGLDVHRVLLKRPDDARVPLRVVTIGEDHAGNLETGAASPQAAFAAKLARQAATGTLKQILIDETQPFVAGGSLQNAARVNFRGTEYDYVKAGAPVEFSVCALDPGAGRSIQRAELHLDYIENISLSQSFEAERFSCADGKEGFRYAGWGAVNANKTLFPDGAWAANFVVFDMADNRISYALSTLVLDSVKPTIRAEDPVYPSGQAAVKPGDRLVARFLADDAWGVDERALRVDAPTLNATGSIKPRQVRAGGVVWHEAALAVDAASLKPGVHNVTVRVLDNAGNANETSLAVVVDFTPFEFDGPVTVVNVTHNAVVLRWNTTEPATSQVRFGPSLAEMRTRTSVNGTFAREHEVRVENLRPSTRYFFSAASTTRAGIPGESDPVEAATLTALYLKPLSPQPGDFVGGEAPVRFEGGLRDSSEFVSFTLEAQSREDGPWTFVTTVTRSGENHTIRFNSTRHLDGPAYRLRLTAEAEPDVASVVLGPFTLDNTEPALTVVGPAAATNDTTPRVHVEARDALSGFAAGAATLRIDGERIEDATAETTAEGLRVAYDVPAALSQGPHLIEVAVTDRAGNVGRASWKVFVDGEAPLVRVNPSAFSPSRAAAVVPMKPATAPTKSMASGVRRKQKPRRLTPTATSTRVPTDSATRRSDITASIAPAPAEPGTRPTIAHRMPFQSAWPPLVRRTLRMPSPTDATEADPGTSDGSMRVSSGAATSAKPNPTDACTSAPRPAATAARISSTGVSTYPSGAPASSSRPFIRNSGMPFSSFPAGWISRAPRATSAVRQIVAW
ncbi:MAG TPA: fibronectin type III domain-containing protein, partial [Candidatus Thermoplasmatota archaeon]|nr:fibronectin type III domain-containing protein [Candidatus Thermoplasmatota archaeon]